MNYTKGEWRIEQESDKLIKFDSPVVSCKHRLGHPPLITIWTNSKYGQDFYMRVALVEEEADAHLIASAPDMYEALKEIIELDEQTRLPMGADLADSIRVFGKQALAKAEGIK